MYGQPQSTRIGYQQVIDRKEDEYAVGPAHICCNERYRILRDPNSISLRVAILSLRAKICY